jgi:small subunit ribosomal protein S4
MGRYTGPKGRINRRLATMVYESAGAIRAAERRETPPGMYGRRKKFSTYGAGFAEKQKIKFYYGIREAQLRRYFEMARKTKGNTGETLMLLLERRLDNVVRRAGFAHTRPQARQGIVHSHFQLNGRTVATPSIVVHAGDVITVRNRPNLQAAYRAIVDSTSSQRCEWISFDTDGLKAIVTSLPGSSDISIPVDVGQIITFMAR